MSVLILKNMTIDDINLQCCSFGVGAIQMTAYFGFINALGFKIKGGDYTPDRFSLMPILHDMKPLFFRGESENNKSLGVYHTPFKQSSSSLLTEKDVKVIGHSKQPELKTRARISLVVKFDDEDFSEKKVKSALKELRFAGGKIFNIGEIEVLDYFDINDFSKKNIQGYWIKDRTDYMQECLQNDEFADPLDVFIDIVCSLKKAYNEKIAKLDVSAEYLEKESDESWMNMSQVGYIPISSRIKRDGTRDNLEHQFSESLMGIVQYVSLRKEKFTENMWRRKHDKESYILGMKF